LVGHGSFFPLNPAAYDQKIDENTVIGINLLRQFQAKTSLIPYCDKIFKGLGRFDLIRRDSRAFEVLLLQPFTTWLIQPIQNEPGWHPRPHTITSLYRIFWQAFGDGIKLHKQMVKESRRHQILRKRATGNGEEQ
jgi:hypothetical protein